MTLNMPMPGTTGGAKITFKNMNNFEFEKIGIVGLGFVGGAIKVSLDHGFGNVVCVDPFKGGYTNTINDLKDCIGVFVCVPTPQSDDGKCDTQPLESVLKQLKDIDYQGVIISKCTAPPDVYTRLNEEFPNLVHAPEFLTAANAEVDYANGKFAFIGGRILAYQKEAERIIRLTQPQLSSNVHFCSIGEASLAKYAINSFLSTKVMFMNELHSLATASGLNYNTVAKMVSLDERIGRSHMKVPGPDGQFGFGGACFPKDTSALLKYAESIGVPLNVLDAAVKKNTLVRLTESK